MNVRSPRCRMHDAGPAGSVSHGPLEDRERGSSHPYFFRLSCVELFNSFLNNTTLYHESTPHRSFNFWILLICWSSISQDCYMSFQHCEPPIILKHVSWYLAIADHWCHVEEREGSDLTFVFTCFSFVNGFWPVPENFILHHDIDPPKGLRVSAHWSTGMSICWFVIKAAPGPADHWYAISAIDGSLFLPTSVLLTHLDLLTLICNCGWPSGPPTTICLNT